MAEQRQSGKQHGTVAHACTWWRLLYLLLLFMPPGPEECSEEIGFPVRATAAGNCQEMAALKPDHLAAGKIDIFFLRWGSAPAPGPRVLAGSAGLRRPERVRCL